MLLNMSKNCDRKSLSRSSSRIFNKNITEDNYSDNSTKNC